MITKKDRIKLRSIAQTLPDLVQIGKEGISDNLIEQINKNLFSHELVKIKVMANCDDSMQDLADEIAKLTDCEIVTIIGRKIIVYKLSSKDKIKHVL